MTDAVYSEVYDPRGTRVWRGPPKERSRCAELIGDRPGAAVLRALCGVPPESGWQPCSRGDVLTLAEDLEFVSRDGAPYGFLNVLPRGALLERVVMAFNRPHLRALDATRLDVPLLFDLAEDDLRELTASYERQDRMFRLADPDSSLRLAYAADPGLFGWLRGRRLLPEHLPYAIFSPLPVFRRLQSGEVTGVDKLRQYDVPDVHVLCRAERAYASYLRAVELAAEGAAFWFGEERGQFIDIAADARETHPDLGPDAARAAGAYTLVNVLAERPRYYAWRSGIIIHAGYSTMMLYNLQWDDTNPQRFDLTTTTGDDVVILHATVAGGWPKMLPLVLGRGLSGLAPPAFPPELSPEQLVLLPLTDRHHAHARRLADELEDRLRVVVDTGTDRPLGSRLEKLRDGWRPCYTVIGDREEAGDTPRVEWTTGRDPAPVDEFLARHRQRLERCRVEGFPVHLPF